MPILTKRLDLAFLPYEEWARTKVYELDPGTGKATVRFDTPGDIFKWIKVR